MLGVITIIKKKKESSSFIINVKYLARFYFMNSIQFFSCFT